MFSDEISLFFCSIKDFFRMYLYIVALFWCADYSCNKLQLEGLYTQCTRCFFIYSSPHWYGVHYSVILKVLINRI